MPDPSSTTASQITAEAYPSRSTTAQLELTDPEVRNLACVSSGAISYGNCRWGINFRGGSYSQFTRDSYYGTSNILAVDVYESAIADGFSTAQATGSLSYTSGGTGTVFAGLGTYNHTWLTSGAAGDYTIQLQKSTGNNPNGASLNTDLAMSTTRTWTWATPTIGPGAGSSTLTFTGNIIVKTGGTTLITRPVSIVVIAEVII